MKAILLNRHATIEEHPLEICDIPRPNPCEDEMLIRISACGLCHTDLDEIEGRLEPAMMPVVPGHQVVGRVEQPATAAPRFQAGDRVGVTWLYSSCGTCEFCTSGRENLCSAAKWTGKDANGGYAEYMVVPEHFAHPLPSGLSDVQIAPLLCAGVIGYRTVHLANIENGQKIGLFGFGASAHIVIQVVRHLYPDSSVFVFTRSRSHQNLALDLGAEWAGSPNQTPPARIHRAMDFTPVGQTVPVALSVLEKGGRLVINAIRKITSIPEFDYAERLWGEREIKSVANVTRADAEQFLPLAARIPIRPTVETFAFQVVNDALMKLKHSQVCGAAVLCVD